MAKVPAFFLFGPAEIEGDHVQNAHMFNGSYDSETKKWVCHIPSRCGQVRIESSKPKHLVRATNEKEFCHAVVDGHGVKFNACGMCMATFFADEE